MRYIAVLGLLCLGCGADPEVRREFYPVFPVDAETGSVESVPAQASSGCEEILTKLLEAGRLKRRKWESVKMICEELQ